MWPSLDGLQIASRDREEVHLLETNLRTSRPEVQRTIGPVLKTINSSDGRTFLSVSNQGKLMRYSLWSSSQLRSMDLHEFGEYQQTRV